MFQGGVQTNVIPNKLTAVFDIRIEPNVTQQDFEAKLDKWCREAGEGVYYTFEEKNNFVENTKLDDSNPYWLAFKNSCDDQKLNLEIGIFPGGTDSRYIREVSYLNIFLFDIIYSNQSIKIVACWNS